MKFVFFYGTKSQPAQLWRWTNDNPETHSNSKGTASECQPLAARQGQAASWIATNWSEPPAQILPSKSKTTRMVKTKPTPPLG
jgi:hypothetical protein